MVVEGIISEIGPVVNLKRLFPSLPYVCDVSRIRFPRGCFRLDVSLTASDDHRCLPSIARVGRAILEVEVLWLPGSHVKLSLDRCDARDCCVQARCS